jgi:hypothetical protein
MGVGCRSGVVGRIFDVSHPDTRHPDLLLRRLLLRGPWGLLLGDALLPPVDGPLDATLRGCAT